MPVIPICMCALIKTLFIANPTATICLYLFYVVTNDKKPKDQSTNDNRGLCGLLFTMC